MQSKKLAIEIITALLVLMFLYAATVKLIDLRKFVSDMNNQPIPNWLTPFFIISVLATEILIAVLVIFKKTKLVAFYLSAVIMSAFTLYIFLIKLRAFGHVPCSCGGIIKNFSWWQHLFFNLFFLAISIVAIILDKQIRVEPQQTEQDLGVVNH